MDYVCCLEEEGYHLFFILAFVNWIQTTGSRNQWFHDPLALMHKALSLESLEFRWKRTTLLPKLEQVHEFMVRKGEPGPFEHEYGTIQ